MNTSAANPPRTRLAHRPLLWANAGALSLLAVVCAWPVLAPASTSEQPGRARGTYTMVAGRPTSGGTDVIYVIDAANQEILALRPDSAKRLQPLGFRSLNSDTRVQPGR
ncbi:MAG: hypothetical protein SFZ23_00305 [Planctomycetota bacterium]|nr:hypothetical protein [Planctomycetota bacterium]